VEDWKILLQSGAPSVAGKREPPVRFTIHPARLYILASPLLLTNVILPSHSRRKSAMQQPKQRGAACRVARRRKHVRFVDCEEEEESEEEDTVRTTPLLPLSVAPLSLAPLSLYPFAPWGLAIVSL
jgi:hypothetical protein